MKLRYKILSIRVIFGLCLGAFSAHVAAAQAVKVFADSVNVTVGQSIKYQISVETDSLLPVDFPKRAALNPLAVADSSAVDTVKEQNLYRLTRTYTLIGFDEKIKAIPAQFVKVGDRLVKSDSIPLNIRTIPVDTISMQYFDAKPITEVDRISSFSWRPIIYILIGLVLGVGGWLAYRFRRRLFPKKENIETLPPFEKAQKLLDLLSESNVLDKADYKFYYSGLTGTLKRYIEEEISLPALESTSEELITVLELYVKKYNIRLEEDFFDNFRKMLHRSDMSKFAKSAPQRDVAETDFNLTRQIIFEVKKTLPQTILEAKQAAALTMEAVKKEHRKKTIRYSIYAGVALVVFSIVGFVAYNGFRKTFDTLTGHPTLKALQRPWVASTYGFPPVGLETPDILKRVVLSDSLAQRQPAQGMTTFRYGGLKEKILIFLNMKAFPQPITDSLLPSIVSPLITKQIEELGAKNILNKEEDFTAPDGSKGLKTYGNFNLAEESGSLAYTVVTFANNEYLVQLGFVYEKDDPYALEIESRVLKSIKLNDNNKKAAQP